MSLTDVKTYWHNRAKTADGAPHATTNDIHLRRLEVRTILSVLDELALAPDSRILDAGCGDGRTLNAIAQGHPDLVLTGVDVAPAMIDAANSHGAGIEFHVADVRELNTVGLPPQDVIMTDRCLINLADDAEQARAMANIAATLRPGGVYLAIENFREGHDAMNESRTALGLPEIPIRWHNHYFTNASFAKAAAPFSSVECREFASAYYHITRVVYSKLCMERGTEPDYDHDLHRIAVDVPTYGAFAPMRLAILRKT